MIQSKEQIIKYFKSGIKKTNDFKIGIEHEKFLFSNNKRVNYSKIKEMFQALQDFGWKPVLEKENIIGLNKGGKNITLEPGNQIELSGDKLNHMHEACAESQDYLFELEQVTKKLNIKIVSSGFDPFSKLEEIPNNPKERYKLMTKSMPLGGELSLDMMYRTCGTQLNIDYNSEEDFKKKFLITNSIVPITIALFANSSIVEKKNSNYLSYRSKVWQSTSRGGLPKLFFENLDFEKYAEFIMRFPILFIQHEDKYVSGSSYTFNDFMNGKINEIENRLPTENDLTVHLSTIFTENRLKKYIELRSMDTCGWDCLCAGPAFFIGLLYGNLDEVFDIVKKWNINEIISAYKDSPKNGLKTILGKKTILDWSKDLFEISRKGLINRNELNSKKQNEVKFLDHIKTIIDTSSTNAESIIAKYKKDKNFFYINEK